ncbi:MAG: hypothetical protein ACK4U0_10335 [Mesorhizobium sp.]
MMRLAVRFLPVFAVIIGFAVALAAYMNFSGVRTAYLDLVRARMEMIATAVATDVAAANSIGIALPEQSTLPELLSRQAAADPLLRSIDVTGVDGTIIFSSDPGRVGAAHSDDVPVLRHFAQVTNDLGAVVGTIDVRLDRAGIDAALDRLRLDVFASALPAGLGAVGVGCLMALLLLSGLYRRARRFSEQHQPQDPISRAETEVARLRLESVA